MNAVLRELMGWQISVEGGVFTSWVAKNRRLCLTAGRGLFIRRNRSTYKEFVCICFAMGAKLPQDSAIQFVRSKSASLGTTRHRVDKIYSDLRVALAWMEHRLSLKKEYSSAVVEPDSCRTGSSQRGAVRRHLGRTLVLTPRGKRTWSSFALPPSASKAKGRGMGAEKISEITKPMERVKSNCIVAPDGGPAFQICGKKARTRLTRRGVPHSTYLHTGGKAGQEDTHRGSSQNSEEASNTQATCSQGAMSRLDHARWGQQG